MTHEGFWKLIDKARKTSEGDLDEMVDLLRGMLTKLPPAEIVDFGSIYDEMRYKAFRRELWGAAYLLNGGCSDDGFEYFRGWLIAQGKAVYEAALQDPDSLARFADPEEDDHELEELAYVAQEAYQEKTGEEMAPPKEYPDLTGREWKEEDLDRLYPRIAKRLRS